MSYSEDHIVLAAEYVLGTLDYGERVQVETMMSVDAAFKAIVDNWERKLGELHVMVGSVEPPSELWEKIKAEVSLSPSQPPVVLPEISPPPLTPVEIAPEFLEQRAKVIEFSAMARRWRGIAAVATVLAASLTLLVAVQLYKSDLLTRRSHSKSHVEVVQAPPSPAPPLLPSSSFIAVLQKNTEAPAFILTIDMATKTFTARKVKAELEQGKSYELWLVSDKLPQPRSLGIIGNVDFTIRPALAAYDAETIHKATYTVTLEPEGGSPTGIATGPIVFTGKLIEAVPSAPTW